jgi:hypothetical protein
LTRRRRCADADLGSFRCSAFIIAMRGIIVSPPRSPTNSSEG